MHEAVGYTATYPTRKGSNEVGESRQKLNPFDFTPRLPVYRIYIYTLRMYMRANTSCAYRVIHDIRIGEIVYLENSILSAFYSSVFDGEDHCHRDRTRKSL